MNMSRNTVAPGILATEPYNRLLWHSRDWPGSAACGGSYARAGMRRSSRFLQSGDGLILKNADPHTAVLCFSLWRVYLFPDLTTLAHGRRGNHVSQRDV